MAIPNSFDLSSAATAQKALKKISQLMLRAGQPVVSFDYDPKLKRTSGVTYREALLTLASGQTVTLRVTQTGDIYQVLLNNSIKPIKNASDQIKAAGEIAKYAEANQAAFQKSKARVRVELPKGLKTAAPRMEVALTSRVAELDSQIAARQGQIAELKAELGESALDSVGTDPAPPDLDAARAMADAVIDGVVLDSADTAAAVATLLAALEVVETNYPINVAEGNVEQAALELASAESFRTAISLLDDTALSPAPKPQEPETAKESHASDEALSAEAAFQAEEPNPETATLDYAGQPRDKSGRYTSPSAGGGGSGGGGGGSGGGGAGEGGGGPGTPPGGPTDAKDAEAKHKELERLKAEAEAKKKEQEEEREANKADREGGGGGEVPDVSQLDPNLAAAKELGDLAGSVKKLFGK